MTDRTSLNFLRLDADRALLLLIDLQEKLVPLIANRGPMLESIEQLVHGARLFGLSICVTEQYPRGIGHTCDSVMKSLEGADVPIFEKSAFSCWGDDDWRAHIRTQHCEQLILAGIESHVCVQQTTLDLLSRDYQVFICANAIGSRRVFDHEVAIHRMRQAGAIITTVESVLFELCERCTDSRFKSMIEWIKQRRESD